MKRLLMAALLALALLLAGCGEERQYEYTFTGAFDTVTVIKGYASSKSEFDSNARLIEERLNGYHKLFDIYNSYEGVNNLKTVNDGAGKVTVAVDKQVTELLDLCREFYEATGGRLNAASGAVLSLWHEARESGTLPDAGALEAASEHCDPSGIVMGEDGIYIPDAKMSLDVGAFAKGWAVEKACEGIPGGYLINAGGNVYATGPKPDGSAWTVGIADPRGEGYIKKTALYSGAVVTSGDYERGFYYEGHWYSHIIDVQTLYPAEKYASVTVVCPSSACADALSTALFVLDADEGRALAEKYGAAAMWAYDDGSVEIYDPEGGCFTND